MSRTAKVSLWVVASCVSLCLVIALAAAFLFGRQGNHNGSLLWLGLVEPSGLIAFALMVAALFGTGRFSIRSTELWVAAAFAFAGLVIVGIFEVLAIERGESTRGAAARLGFIIPVVAATTFAVMGVFRAERRALDSKIFLVWVVAACALGSFAVPLVTLGKSVMATMIPAIRPFGADFYSGLYAAASSFSTVSSSWPPLTLILAYPYTLMESSDAYLVHCALIVLMGIAAAWLSASLASKGPAFSDEQSNSRTATKRRVFYVSAFWLFTSYGFLYEIERGQVNLLTLVFCLLFVWSLLRFPQSVWVPTFFLAIAINIKVYPAVLLFLLFWRHRWKALGPVLFTNIVFLAVAGPTNLSRFLTANLSLQGDTAVWLWPGNFSASSFGIYLHNAFSLVPEWIDRPLLAMSVGLWFATAIVLVRRGWSQRGAVLLAAASIPLMCTLPAVSHEYKLVVMIFPFAVLGAFLIGPTTGTRGARLLRSALFGALLLEIVLLGTPAKFWVSGAGNVVGWVEARNIIANKFPELIVMQLMFLVVAAYQDRLVSAKGLNAEFCGQGPATIENQPKLKIRRFCGASRRSSKSQAGEVDSPHTTTLETRT